MYRLGATVLTSGQYCCVHCGGSICLNVADQVPCLAGCCGDLVYCEVYSLVVVYEDSVELPSANDNCRSTSATRRLTFTLNKQII